MFLAFTMDLSLTLLKGPRIRISAAPGYQSGRIDRAFFRVISRFPSILPVEAVGISDSFDFLSASFYLSCRTLCLKSILKTLLNIPKRYDTIRYKMKEELWIK